MIGAKQILRTEFKTKLGNYYDVQKDDIGGICWLKDDTDTNNDAEIQDEAYLCFKNLKLEDHMFAANQIYSSYYWLD